MKKIKNMGFSDLGIFHSAIGVGALVAGIVSVAGSYVFG